MTRIGAMAGKKTVAMITAMDQPLGNAVGNSLEVEEAIQVLKGNGPEDITELSLKLAGMMIYLAGIAEDAGAGEKMAAEALKSGAALEALRKLIEGQGGDPAVIDDPKGVMGIAKHSKDIVCTENGYVNKIHGTLIGEASMNAGAGRKQLDDEIDLTAGIVLAKKEGDAVKKGDVLCTIYSSDAEKLENSKLTAEKAFEISKEKPDDRPIIIDVITA